MLLFYGYFFFIVKGIYTWSAIKAVGTLRRIVPLQLLGRLRESADLNSDDGTALLMEWMDETSVYQSNAEKTNKQTNTETNKKTIKKAGWGRVQQTNTTRSFVELGLETEHPVFKTAGASINQPFLSFSDILQHYYSHTKECEIKENQEIYTNKSIVNHDRGQPLSFTGWVLKKFPTKQREIKDRYTKE